MLNQRHDEWDIDEGQFPEHGNANKKWRFLLRYAVLAPSTRNTQPWKFQIKGELLELYADRDRVVQAFDPRGREMIMSCGAALFTLRVALEHFQCHAKITTFPRYGDHELLARLEIVPGKGVPRDLRMLFPSIQNRHTQRMPFDGRKPPDALLREIRREAKAEGAILSLVDGQDSRKEIAQLIAEGNRRQAGSAIFRQQLGQLFRSNYSVRRDGMPGYVYGLGWLRSLLMPWLIEKGEWGEDVAVDDYMAVMFAPCLAVLAIKGDTTETWLAAGQALARVLLRACHAGVSASFLSQAIEVPELRARLQSVMGIEGFPQLVLRMGYGAKAEPTPRRRLRDVLVT